MTGQNPLNTQEEELTNKNNMLPLYSEVNFYSINKMNSILRETGLFRLVLAAQWPTSIVKKFYSTMK